MTSISLNTIEINLAALRSNYLEIRRLLGARVQVMAIVKSDAYGHGLVEASRSLAAAGACVFGVAEVEEGVRLRQAGLNGEIVVLLGALPDSFADVVHYGLTPVVFDRDSLKGLAAVAERRNSRVRVHLKVDVGMGRLGIMPGEVISFAEEINRLAGLHLAGVISHLPAADELDSAGTTMAQLRHFEEIIGRLARLQPNGGVCHVANSAGLLNFAASHLDMVRPGITLYGCHPGGGFSTSPMPVNLMPVMSFKTRVLQVKDVPTDTGLSYGHTFVTKRPTRLAVLPVGYDDGYLRRLSNRAEVLIHGRRVPVCGRVCMNACLADVTDLPATVRPGDEVVLLGRQQEMSISAAEVAGWLETISYEVLCLFGARNRRVYVD